MVRMAAEPTPSERPRTGTGEQEARPARLPALSLWARILVFVAGWTLLLIGIVGLALPGIQGILTILLGAAVLSLVSETVYRLLRRVLRRWPGLWDKIDRIRRKAHQKLHRPQR